FPMSSTDPALGALDETDQVLDARFTLRVGAQRFERILQAHAGAEDGAVRRAQRLDGLGGKPAPPDADHIEALHRRAVTRGHAVWNHVERDHRTAAENRR